MSIGLVVGGVCAVAAYAASKVMRFMAREAVETNFETPLPIVGMVLASVAGITFGIAAMVNLLEPTNWAAAISPDIAMFKGAVQAMRK